MPEVKYVPQRKCIACRTVRPKEELIRVALTEEGLKVDPSGRLPGRGCYVCRSIACIKAAAEKNCFSRSFRKGFTKDQTEAAAEELMKYRD